MDGIIHNKSLTVNVDKEALLVEVKQCNEVVEHGYCRGLPDQSLLRYRLGLKSFLEYN